MEQNAPAVKSSCPLVEFYWRPAICWRFSESLIFPFSYIPMIRTTLLCLLLSFLLQTVWAQVDTVNIASHSLQIKQLQPSKRQYLVYLKLPQKNNRIMRLSQWTREVRFEKRNNREVVVIQQRWDGEDTLFNRTLYSICQKENFQPMYHFAHTLKTGTDAFTFLPEKIAGTDTVAQNTKKDFRLAVKQLPFNWELDLETFEMLPLQAGKQFAICFYHPGGSKGPDYYLYKVNGSEKLTLSGGIQADCWKLRIDYDAKNYAIFWITKKQPEVLKMEEFYNGIYRYKVKLSNSI